LSGKYWLINVPSWVDDGVFSFHKTEVETEFQTFGAGIVGKRTYKIVPRYIACIAEGI
jgi:hypothetical protein